MVGETLRANRDGTHVHLTFEEAVANHLDHVDRAGNRVAAGFHEDRPGPRIELGDDLEDVRHGRLEADVDRDLRGRGL